VCIGLSYVSLNAQKGLYLQVRAGHAFQMTNDELGSPRAEIGQTNLMVPDTSTISEMQAVGTLGGGTNFGLTVGYMFGEHIGVELGVNYTIGTEVTMAEIQGATYNAYHRAKSVNLKLMPAIVLSAGPGHKVNPYARMGIVIPVTGVLKSDILINDDEGRLAGLLLTPDEPNPAPIQGFTSDISAKAESFGAFSLGGHAAFGINLGLNDNLGIFGEVEMIMLAVQAKKTIFTEFSNLTDASFISEPLTQSLEDLTLFDIETQYVKEITQNSNHAYNPNGTNPDQPGEELRFKTNYNSVGINIGVRYKF